MSRRDELYVGYLAVPEGQRGFVKMIAAVLVLVVVGAGGVIAGLQGDPGDGVWDTSAVREWSGALVEEPYPMLVQSDGTVHLLVGVGKFGVQDRVAGLSGGARVRGFALEREGRRMIELLDGDEGIEVLDDVVEAARVRIDLTGEEVALAGEVLDGKCYLGAMKPGDGKGHKACATLCIEGGIPVMFFADIAGEGRRTYLLVDSGGGSAKEEVLAFVGEPVLVQGKVGRVGDLDVIALDSIERVLP